MGASIDPDRVQWARPDTPLLYRRCTICGNEGPQPTRLVVPSLVSPHQLLTLLACGDCGGLFYDPPEVTSFQDLNQRDEDFWRFYVEVGGGVWETIWPLAISRSESQMTLLDVGCGFGFAVDYWRQSHVGGAVGVEMADYGPIGAAMLGITVYGEALENCGALRGRHFDRVYASEVIEHVPDAGAFVKLLATFVSPDGVLILTTPASEFVVEGNDSPTLLAALAPGFHGFLLSPGSLEALARDAGLSYVVVRTFRERTVLWASRVALELDFAAAGSRDSYLDYLRGWTEQHTPDTPVWHGYGYRLVRDLVNLGRARDALPILGKLVAALNATFDIPIGDPERFVEALRSATNLVEFGKIAPYFLPNIYFAMAMSSELHDGDLASATRYYDAAEAIAVVASRIGAVYFLEAVSLIWPARVALMRLAVVRGDWARAAMLAKKVARGGVCAGRDGGYERAPRALVEGSIPRTCEELARRGQWDLASDVFSGFVDYLDALFPNRNWLDVDSVRRFFTGAHFDGPAEPAFALFFQAVLDARESGAAVTSGKGYNALLALRELVSRDSDQARQLETYLRAAIWLVPPRPVQIDYRFTFTLNNRAR